MSIIKFNNLRLTTTGYAVDIVAEGFKELGAISLKWPHAPFLKVYKVTPYTIPIKKGMFVWHDNGLVAAIAWSMTPSKDAIENERALAHDGRLFTVYFKVISHPFAWQTEVCEIADRNGQVIPTEFIQEVKV